MPDLPQVRGKRFLLSLVVPMRNEEDSIAEFLTRVRPAVEQVGCDYEIVCVNDGSTDRTLEFLKTALAGDRRIKIVDLARNFGKDLALTAGIDHAEGDAIIPLDADLQRRFADLVEVTSVHPNSEPAWSTGRGPGIVLRAADAPVGQLVDAVALLRELAPLAPDPCGCAVTARLATLALEPPGCANVFPSRLGRKPFCESNTSRERLVSTSTTFKNS